MARVVIVDDNAEARVVLEGLLARCGMQVVGHGATGEDALRLVAHHQPEAVVLDVRMPLMDGIKATAILRARGYLGHIICYSGLSHPDVATRCLRAGANRYLPKPLSRSELGECLEQVGLQAVG